MKNILLALLVIVCFNLAGCCSSVQNLPVSHAEISPLFTTEAVFENPESILFDPVTRQLFVANVNGHPLTKDGNGFISKVAINGDVRDLHWITGLNAPKGMTLIGDLLYIADIDQLLIVDISNENKEIIPVEGAVFLNDITHDDSGRVYVSDFLTDTIHSYFDGVLSTWLHDEQLKSPRGLHVKDGFLYVGSWGRMVDGFKTELPGDLLRIHLQSKDIAVFAEGLGNLDGVASYGDSFVMTDSMAGRLLLLNSPFDPHSVERIPLKSGSADLCVLPEDWELVVVPLMGDNKLQGFTIAFTE